MVGQQSDPSTSAQMPPRRNCARFWLCEASLGAPFLGFGDQSHPQQNHGVSVGGLLGYPINYLLRFNKSIGYPAILIGWRLFGVIRDGWTMISWKNCTDSVPSSCEVMEVPLGQAAPKTGPRPESLSLVTARRSWPIRSRFGAEVGFHRSKCHKNTENPFRVLMQHDHPRSTFKCEMLS